MSLITVADADDVVIPAVAEKVALDADYVLPAVSIGVFDTVTHRLVAGVIFNCYQGHSIAGTIAAFEPGWATRKVLGGLFAYPFLQLGVARLWAQARRNNRKSRKLLEQMGFRYEGMARRGWDARHDAAIYGMLPDECKWLKYYDGQISAEAA